MARKRCLPFRRLQPRQKPLRSSRRQVPNLGWLTHLLLACLIGLLCLVSSPVFAHLSRDIRVSQSLSTATAPQLVQQGQDYYELGQYANAVKVWQQAVEVYQSQSDSEAGRDRVLRLNQAMVLSNLALANQHLGQLSEATAAITTALELLQFEPDTLDRQRILAQVLNTQGSLQMTQGQAEQALTTLQQAEAAYKQVGDEAGIIRSLINQAQVMRALGLYRRALATLTQVNQLLQMQPDSLLKATGLRNLGKALRLVGSFDDSQTVLQQSLEIAKKLSSRPDIGAALLSLGNTARVQQDPETALDYYKQAATLADSPTTRLQAQVNQLNLIAEGDLKGDKSDLAQSLLSQIQAQLTELPLNSIAVYAQINLAQSLLKLETKERFTPPEIAQILATAIQQAKRLGDQRLHSYALGSLGGLYEKNKQWSDAKTLTQQALAISQGINASDIAFRWQWQLGRLLKTQGDENGALSEAMRQSAIAAYSEAVATLQSLRSDLVAINSEVQFSFREEVEPVYREFVGLLLQPSSTSSSQQEVTSPERLEQARKAIESLQLAELDNFFRAACLNAKPVKIDTIDQKAAIIYPIILPDRLEVILSLPQQPLRHYTTAISADDVESSVLQLRQRMTRSIGRGFLPLSQRVYDWLIRPAEANIAQSQVKTLVFVLDGILRSIPMAALHDGTQYVVEKYSVALTPGLELLASQRLERGQLKILSAGLSEGRQGFSPLPNVEVELNQILSQVPGEALLNQEFTKPNLQTAINTAPFPVVHLATHGQFSSEAENTFILTWDSRINVNELNDLLRATDLRRSQPIELLVLSACQTATGDNRAALGIAGVAVRAGARSTLATLWSVNDEATSELMVRFYRELGNPEVTKAEALRRAQLSILNDDKYGQHPYFWGAFILIGNWL